MSEEYLKLLERGLRSDIRVDWRVFTHQGRDSALGYKHTFTDAMLNLVYLPSSRRALWKHIPVTRYTHISTFGRHAGTFGLNWRQQTGSKMFSEIKFMNGLDPTDIKARELAIAEKKSHSARVAHKRRKEKREAFFRFHASGSSPTSGNTAHVSGRPTNDAYAIGYETVPSPRPRKRRSQSVGLSPYNAEDKTTSNTGHPSHTTTVTKTSPADSIVRQPHTSVYLAFNNKNWTQAFQFYLNVSGPLIARCHSLRAGESYTKIIPQIAISSISVRHMLLAYAYYHTQLLNSHPDDAKKPNTYSLYHYSKSLESMRTRSSRMEILAASILGYILEVNQNNSHAAVMHLKGFRAIVRGCVDSQNELFQRLTADYMFTHKLASITSREGGATHRIGTFLSVSGTGWSLMRRGHETGMIETSMLSATPRRISIMTSTGRCLDDIEHARSSLDGIMTDIGNSFPLSDIATRRNIEGLLSTWIDSLSRWEWQQEHSAKKSGLLWLFTLAISLSSDDDDNGHLRRLTASHLHDYIVKDRHFQEQVCAEDIVYMTKMMNTSAKHTIRYLQLPEYQRRLKVSLDYVECSKPHRVLCRAWVAVKHVYYHVMCEEDSRKAYVNEGFLSPTG